MFLLFMSATTAKMFITIEMNNKKTISPILASTVILDSPRSIKLMRLVSLTYFNLHAALFMLKLPKYHVNQLPNTRDRLEHWLAEPGVQSPYVAFCTFYQ